MKTLLVNPPIPNNFYNREFYLPSGLLYLGAVLQKQGDDVKLIDFKPIQKRNPNSTQKFYGARLEEIVSSYKPDMIGFGGLFSGNFLDVLYLSQIVKQKFPEIPIISSRSCPYKCNFCASSEIMGRGWRARSATNVVDEIQLLYEMRQTHFSFMDDNFTFNKSRLLDMCNQIDKRKLNIQFETHNGVSIRTLDDEAISAMASAGLTRIALPIESGSGYMRNKIMRKGLDKEKIFEVVDSLKKHRQIYTRAFFIIGMPEETHETLNDTYKMIQRINVDKVHLTNIVPFPGTDVFKQAMRDNLIVNVDTDNLYKSDQLYQTNVDHFSIKPYNLELSDLHKFRAKCNKMIKGLKK